MKINAQLTLLVSERGADIEIRDKDSGTTFVRMSVGVEEFCKALGRFAYVPVGQCDVYGLENLGKKQEVGKLEFPLPETTYSNKKEVAAANSHKYCPEGWKPDNYFNSKDSFFRKDGEDWARCTIRRYVEKENLCDRHNNE